MIKLEALRNGWYGRLEDLEEEIKDIGYDVLEVTREYITCVAEGSGDDTQYMITLGGTERTIIVEEIMAQEF